MRNRTVFLCADRQENVWCVKAKDYLTEHNMIRSFDPSRHQQHGVEFKELYTLYKIDLKNSDVMLVDVSSNKDSMEVGALIAYAREVLDIPVIGWCEDCVSLDSPMIHKALLTNCFNSLEGALDHITAYYV